MIRLLEREEPGKVFVPPREKGAESKDADATLLCVFTGSKVPQVTPGCFEQGVHKLTLTLAHAEQARAASEPLILSLPEAEPSPLGGSMPLLGQGRSFSANTKQNQTNSWLTNRPTHVTATSKG